MSHLNISEAPIHYSTPFIVETLNGYLSCAASALFQASDTFKAQFICMISVYQTDHRKLIAAAPFHEVQRAIVQAIATNDFQPIAQCYLDRSIFYSAVAHFMNQLSGLKDKQIKLLKRSHPPQRLVLSFDRHKIALGLTTDPLILYNEVVVLLKQYVEFRNSIINNYVRLAQQQAARSLRGVHGSFDKNEFFMNYVLAVHRGVDKCDRNKGTLTSYIGRWFLEARSSPQFNAEYGIAYDLPAHKKLSLGKRSGKRRKKSNGINFSESLEDLKDEDYNTDAAESTVHNPSAQPERITPDQKPLFLRLRRFRDLRLAYLVTGLPIVLTDKEVARLHRQAA